MIDHNSYYFRHPGHRPKPQLPSPLPGRFVAPQERGALCIECAKAIQLLFNLLPGVKQLEPGLSEVLKEMADHVAALSQVFV